MIPFIQIHPKPFLDYSGTECLEGRETEYINREQVCLIYELEGQGLWILELSNGRKLAISAEEFQKINIWI